ncbi:hypothetical protein GPECTOR_1g712 [Gonium pectorale]|uniref:Uncharacterized protein n=1 Tax=Gonium pectorale TaxID=33097 RepID=A0A150H408_GONPE|nr:hypothetical protein GPECTOR_1g712 [Gonium pectorale]|eukprot:KXZ56791.1 hypothetical protein GPECTOR_1g712 [Gonium pectorale]
MSLHRRSRRGNALSPISTPREDAASTQFNEQSNIFKLQLRPLEDPESFKPSAQLVSCEFATRYLESVGVRPSKATMDLVHRNMPLTESHIKTTLRAKGHVEDEIHISVPPVTHHYRVPVFINPAAVLQLGIGNSVLAADGAAAEEGAQTERATSGLAAGPRTSTTASGGGGRQGDNKGPASPIAAGPPGHGHGGAPGRGPSGTDFLDMASRYLHPFNLDVNLARQNVAALYAAARPRTSSDEGGARADTRMTGGSGAGMGGGGCGGGGGGWGSMPSTSGRVGSGGRHEASGLLASTGGSNGSGPWPGGRRAGSWPRSNSGTMRPGTTPAAAGESGGGGGMAGASRLEIMEELVQPLLVTPEVVLTLQAQLEAALADWHRHQAPEALKGRLTPEEFARTQEELSSEPMVKLLITLVNFLHEELIRGHPSYPAHLEARLSSRDGLRSGQGRRQESSLEDRGMMQRGGSISGESAIGLGGGGLRGGTASGHRSSAQLPTTMSMQQMTNLQKYDLGYQAYVRQKLEQRHRSREGSPSSHHGGPSRGGGGGGAHGARSGSSSPPPTGGTFAGGERPSQHHQAHSLHQQANRHLESAPEPALDSEAQRVSFAAAPHYSPPPLPDDRPDSGSGRGTAGSLFGSLNLPGAPATRSGGSSSAHGHGHGRGHAPPHRGSSATSLATSAPTTAPASPISGLPPRVDRALRHSPSFALAAAANTARSIHASLNAADSAALQRERLFALHVDFAGRFKVLRQSRSGMFFTLPILLLAMRLCVNTLFSTLYPQWTRTAEGAQVLADMDGAIRALFDPHAYLERALSLLQSTPSAIEAVTRHPQRRGNERQHFNDTSPLMQATLKGAKSAGARKLMQSPCNQTQSRGLLRTQLTHEQRATLFQLGLQWMQRPDPVLSQIGEPHAVGRL